MAERKPWSLVDNMGDPNYDALLNSAAEAWRAIETAIRDLCEENASLKTDIIGAVNKVAEVSLRSDQEVRAENKRLREELAEFKAATKVLLDEIISKDNPSDQGIGQYDEAFLKVKAMCDKPECLVRKA